jgi:primosomal protein N' (replication factor Y)
MRYPPVVSLVSATVRARTQAAAMSDAAILLQRVRQVNVPGLEILGPAPAPLTKLRSEYRVQILLKGTGRRHMREALLAAVRSRPEIARRTVVDVDPVNVL